VGISRADYEEMTPYELSLHIQVFNEKRIQEDKDKIALVHLGEYLHRTKKLPTLKQLLNLSEKKEAMSDDEMFEQVKKLNAMFGGATAKEVS
jgi:hypothetical protein